MQRLQILTYVFFLNNVIFVKLMREGHLITLQHIQKFFKIFWNVNKRQEIFLLNGTKKSLFCAKGFEHAGELSYCVAYFSTNILYFILVFQVYFIYYLLHT